MDIVLICLALIFIIAGIVGCVVPGLPGPPLNLIGLILLTFVNGMETIHWAFWVFYGIITTFIVILDYVLPIWGTKKLGGSKRGVWGAAIGLFVGIFASVGLGPFGIIILPFVGAVIGELTTQKELKDAMKAGVGALFGILVSTVGKLTVSVIITIHFIIILTRYLI